MSNDAILFDVEDGVAKLTLNRPERLNAFSGPMGEAWAERAAEAVGRDDVGAILLRASGRAFCAGGDVRAMAEEMTSGAEIERLAHVINRGVVSLVQSAKPVVAAAHGTTAGGGLGILLSSDYAIIGEGSRIGCLYANIGLTPDLSVSALLARAVGERRALQLALQPRLLSAQEALDWGLVAEVVPDDEVQARADEVARHWAENAPEAYGRAKLLLRSRPERSFAEQLDLEARTIGEAFETPEAQTRIRVFAKK